MNDRRLIAAATLLALGACGGAPEAPSPATTELAYTIPATNPATYSSADTAHINIMVQPGMPMEQTMGQNSTVRLTFAPRAGTPGNLSVTAAYVDFAAFAESSMMPRQDVGGEGLTGDFTLSLTPEGDVEVVAGPELPEAIERMSMNNNLFADFFVRLPNRLVHPGESWTDTIRFEDETEVAHTTNEAIVVSTFLGDTTVAGRTLWVIHSNKTTSLVVEGDMQGMAMRNELSGSIVQRTLWDPARRLLHSSFSNGNMRGTVSIPGAGMEDIPIDVTNTRYVRLVESGS